MSRFGKGVSLLSIQHGALKRLPILNVNSWHRKSIRAVRKHVAQELQNDSDALSYRSPSKPL